jgi:hypothetical protein
MVRREGNSPLTGAVYLFKKSENLFSLFNEKFFESFTKANKFAFSRRDINQKIQAEA